MITKLKIFTDGGARGNPGPAGIGAVLFDENDMVVAEISRYIGETTNNQAEYQAAVAAMEKAKELGALELDFFLDSQLVVEQLNGRYKVKNAGLAPLFIKLHNARLSFKKVSFTYIPREQNKHADKLVNLAIDSAGY